MLRCGHLLQQLDNLDVTLWDMSEHNAWERCFHSRGGQMGVLGVMCLFQRQYLVAAAIIARILALLVMMFLLTCTQPRYSDMPA